MDFNNINEIRNAWVHNNGIHDIDRTWNIEGIIIEFNKGKPIIIEFYNLPKLLFIVCSKFHKIYKRLCDENDISFTS